MRFELSSLIWLSGLAGTPAWTSSPSEDDDKASCRTHGNERGERRGRVNVIVEMGGEGWGGGGVGGERTADDCRAAGEMGEGGGDINLEIGYEGT